MIPAHVRIFVCTEPVDLRRSFDGLALAARERLGHDPRAGGLFAFVNRRANRLKILWFDRNGYCLLYKRLHQAVFAVPRATDGVGAQIDGGALAQLLAGVARVPRATSVSR
jgi:transposase